MSSAPAEHRDAAAARPADGQAQPQAAAPGSGWTRAALRFAPVIASAVAMAVAGLWGLGRDSAMGNDEVATHWAALLSLRELAHLLRHVDAVHGLYYLLMHGWAAVGSSPTAMRVPSVISMTVAAALIAYIARRLTGSGWAALFAGLIMALTPSISYYAQTARSYALVLACVTGATLALLHAMSAEADGPPQRTARRWLGYAVLVALAGYLNEMALLVLAAHGCTVLLARYGRPAIRHWAIAGAAGAAAVLPLLALSVVQHSAVSWIGRPGLASLRTLLHDYFGVTSAVAVLLLLCAVVAVLPGRRAEPPWWRSRGISLPSVAAPLLVLPAGLLLLESIVARPLYVDRYVLYGEAGAALLAGAGLYRIGLFLARAAGSAGRGGRAGRALIWLPGAVVCALALVLQLGPQRVIRTPDSRAYDFGGPSNYLAAHAQHGDGVLYFGTLFRKAELGYPGDFGEVTDFGVALTPLRAGTFRGTDKPFAATGPLMLRYRRIWVLGSRPSLLLPAGLLRQESQLLEQRFSLITVRRFRGMTVTLWLRR
ncbi:MAG: glycosyltransferase family 39 protein [Streptosporangiaceae bacterium]